MRKLKLFALLAVYTVIFAPRLGLITDIFSEEGVFNFSLAVIFGFVIWRCALLIYRVFINIAGNRLKLSVNTKGVILVLLSLGLTITLLNILSRLIAGV